MIKNSRVEPGKTPSSVSSRISTHVSNGEPLADGEVLSEEKTLEKSSKYLHDERTEKRPLP